MTIRDICKTESVAFTESAKEFNFFNSKQLLHVLSRLLEAYEPELTLVGDGEPGLIQLLPHVSVVVSLVQLVPYTQQSSQ